MTHRKTVAMPTLGSFGLFGDQVMQYAFLRIYAKMHDLDVEVPYWAGERLFKGVPTTTGEGHNRPRPQTLLLGLDSVLPIVWDYWGVDWQNLLGYFLKKTGSHRTNVVIDLIDGRDIVAGAKPCPALELMGWFQFHTTFYSPHKSFFRDLYRPKDDLHEVLHRAWNETAANHTMIGLHLRRGDRLNIPLNPNEWCAPASWYQDWLNQNWNRFRNPVLFVASDSLSEALGYFPSYRAITSDDILAGRCSAKHKEAISGVEFYSDFFFLSQCDVLLTSNSMFSFTSSMLNERGHEFLRPDLARESLVPFDPWDSKPILRRRMYTSFFDRYGEYLWLSFLAGGAAGFARSVFLRLPRFWAVRWGLNRLAAIRRAKTSLEFASY